ncbi:MAG: response regulator [Spirochaetales bacterium]|nr:response regulator [Spirochaetales bacterium]
MGAKILVADDSVSMRQMTGIILKSAGYQIVEAKDGIEALQKLTEDIDLVITDYNMPNKNGVSFIRDVRQGSINKNVPILMLTTETDQEKKNEGKQAGATGWLTKPFDKDSLLKVLQKVLGTLEF